VRLGAFDQIGRLDLQASRQRAVPPGAVAVTSGAELDEQFRTPVNRNLIAVNGVNPPGRPVGRFPRMRRVIRRKVEQSEKSPNHHPDPNCARENHCRVVYRTAPFR
jgi:hypothetical protein